MNMLNQNLEMMNFDLFDAGKEIFMYKGARVQQVDSREGCRELWTVINIDDGDQFEVYAYELESADPEEDLFDA